MYGNRPATARTSASHSGHPVIHIGDTDREDLLEEESARIGHPHAIGLVDQVVDAENLKAAVETMAATLANNAPLTLKATKQIIEGMAAPASDVRVGARWYTEIFRSRDFQEGLDAFFNKRKPEFKGE